MIIGNANPELHKETLEDSDKKKKEYDDAMKANEKSVKEIQKGHGEHGKKVTSKALKSMHLAESIFEEDAHAYSEFESKVYNALADVAWDYERYSDLEVTPADYKKAFATFLKRFFQPNVNESKKSIKESASLKEGWDWKYELQSTDELMQAIDSEDYVGVINALRDCYQELLDVELITPEDFDSYTEDFDLYGDFSDWDDPESTVNYELEQFYDLCDNIRAWVGI